MENLREQLRNPTLFSLLCDVSSGVFEPYINRAEANPIKSPCKIMQDNIVSCKNPEIPTFLKEVDGLDFNTVKIQQKPFSLPFLIPIIDRGMFSCLGNEIKSEIIGISLEDVFSSGPSKKNGRQIQSKLSPRPNVLQSPIFKNKKVVLFGSGRDVLIESLWQNFYKLDFAKIVATMGFTAVTGINFSVFRGECPFGQALNLKKSLKTAEFFHNADVFSVPHIYFAHQLHLDRWIEWLKLNPSVEIIIINCQFRDWENAIFIEEGLIYLIENLGRKIKIILEGTNPKKMLKLFKNYSDWIIVAMKGISMTAEFHHKYEIINDRLVKIRQDRISIIDIFNENFKKYMQYLKNIISL